jgi:outer membrane protein assembly factor BamB
MRHRCLIALVSILAAGCGSSRPPIPPLPELPDGAVRKAMWEHRFGSSDIPLAITPVFAGGAVYAASPRGDVLRIDARTGHVVWRSELGADISGALGANASLVAAGTAGGEVIALTTDGKLRWRVRVSSEVTSPPLVHDDLVIVRTADARVFALDASSGERRWLFQRSPPSLAVRAYSAFAAEGPVVFVGMAGGKLAALTVLNGGPKWESTVSVPRGTTEIERITDVIGAPWTTRTEVCAVAYQGRVSCLNGSNGNALWT